MSDGYLISVGVKADFGDLKAEQKAAQDALKKATAEWKIAYAEFGKAAEGGSAQAIAALKEYETALSESVAREKAASEAIIAARTAANQKRIQQQRDYQEWLQRSKQEGQTLENSNRGVTSSFYAAQGASAALRGAIPYRAMERFLASSQAVSSVLMVAFPVIGALAIGEVIFSSAMKLVDFGIKAEELAQTLGTGWLDGAILQLTGFEKKVKESEMAILKAQQQTDQSISRQKEIQLEIIRLKEGPSAEASARGMQDLAEATRLEAMLPALRERLEIAKQMTHYGELGKAYKSGDFERDMALKNKAQSLGVSTTPALAAEQARETQAQITQIEEDAETKRQEARKTAFDAAAHNEPKLRTGDALAKKEAAAERQANEERYRTDEEAFSRLKMTGDATLQEEESFWQKRLSHYKANTSEYRSILEKVAQIREQADKEQRKHQAEELVSDGKLALESREAVHEGLVAGLKEDADAREQNAAEVAHSAEQQAVETARLAEAKVQLALSTGAITEQSAAHEIAAIHAKEYADRIAALTALLQELQEIQKIDGRDTSKQQSQVRGQISGLQGEAQTAAVNDQAAQAKKFEKPWTIAAQTINREFLSAFDSILSGQVGIARGAEQMAARMVLSFANAMLEEKLYHAQAKEVELAQEAAHWIKVNVLRIADKSSAVATDTSANATKLATTISTNLAAAASNAAVAATGAYAATAMIPFIGPEIAPGVAAATYAGAMGFGAMASAAGGWDRVPSDQIAQIHKNEMVMSAPLAGFIRGAFAGGGSGSHASIHLSHTVNGAGNDREIKKVIRQSSRDVALATKRALRNGHL